MVVLGRSLVSALRKGRAGLDQLQQPLHESFLFVDATRNAQLAGDAAACRDLADQHQRLAALAGEGAGVVGQLVGLVVRRDAQVAALKGQLQVDLQLLATD